MKRILSTSLLALGLVTPPALAQMTGDVSFEPGNYGTMLSGAIRGDEYFDYRLGAQAGQEMWAELSVVDSNGDGTIYFNILPPGSNGEAIYVGSMDDDSTAQIDLPSDGTYTIRVYLMGNDRDTDKTVGYNLDLSIQ